MQTNKYKFIDGRGLVGQYRPLYLWWIMAYQDQQWKRHLKSLSAGLQNSRSLHGNGRRLAIYRKVIFLLQTSRVGIHRLVTNDTCNP